MKLRNKKTGEVREFDELGGFTLSDDYPSLYSADKTYNSLAELNEEWEDYKGPLIKDEKVRKAVRAWAVAESEDCYYGIDDTTLKNGSGDHIEFWSRPFKDLTPYEHYTLIELCGEEEE